MVVMMVTTRTFYFCFFLLTYVILESKFVDDLPYDQADKCKNSHIKCGQII